MIMTDALGCTSALTGAVWQTYRQVFTWRASRIPWAWRSSGCWRS